MTPGAAAGDRAVRLSRLLANQCALLGGVRMGGEEFVWWAQPASSQAAASQTEQLRLALASATEPPPHYGAGVAIGAVAKL